MLNTEELKKDFLMLHTDHGINMKSIEDLSSGKETAKYCLNFFRNMMFLFNGLVAVLILAIIGQGMKIFPSLVAIFLLAIGSVLLVWIIAVFINQVRAYKAMVAVVTKHNLI